MLRKVTLLILIIFFLGSQTISDVCQDNNPIEREKWRIMMNLGRWSWQQPGKVIDLLDVKPGMYIADVGAGYGYFTLGLAELVGERGRIYATDIDEHCLEVIKEDCKKKRIKNVVTILGEELDSKLPEGGMDIVLIVNVISNVKDPFEFLSNIYSGLKPEGTLVIVQWDKEKKFGQILSSDWVAPITKAGFRIIKVENFLPKQFIIISNKK
jgi:ubiquinone/menaquinone biosynthesis C-methylase UbiE